MSWGDVFNRHKQRGCDPSDAAYRADQWEKSLRDGELERARNTPKITGSIMAYLDTAKPDPNQRDLNAVSEADVRTIYNAVKPFVRDFVNFQEVWDAIEVSLRTIREAEEAS